MGRVNEMEMKNGEERSKNRSIVWGERGGEGGGDDFQGRGNRALRGSSLAIDYVLLLWNGMEKGVRRKRKEMRRERGEKRGEKRGERGKERGEKTEGKREGKREGKG